TPGRAGALGHRGLGDAAPHASGVDLGIETGQHGVQVGGVVTGLFSGIALGLHVSAELDQPALFVVGLVRRDGRVGVEVPALAALGHAELPVALGARRALAVEGGPARNVDDLGFAGHDVESPQRDGPDADPVKLGDLFEYVTGHRHGLTDGPR